MKLPSQNRYLLSPLFHIGVSHATKPQAPELNVDRFLSEQPPTETKSPFPQKTIDGVTFDLAPSLAAMASVIINDALTGKNGVVCCVNEQAMAKTWKDPEFLEVLGKATYRTLDGRFIQKYCLPEHEVVLGPDLLPEIMKQLEQARSPIKVLLVGETDKIQKQSKTLLNKNYPNVTFDILSTPQVNQLNKEQTKAFIEKINAENAQIIFVALGCPKQERWMIEHKDDINGVQLGLGDAFAKLVGVYPRPLATKNPVLAQLKEVHKFLARCLHNGFMPTVQKYVEMKEWIQKYKKAEATAS